MSEPTGEWTCRTCESLHYQLSETPITSPSYIALLQAATVHELKHLGQARPVESAVKCWCGNVEQIPIHDMYANIQGGSPHPFQASEPAPQIYSEKMDKETAANIKGWQEEESPALLGELHKLVYCGPDQEVCFPNVTCGKHRYLKSLILAQEKAHKGVCDAWHKTVEQLQRERAKYYEEMQTLNGASAEDQATIDKLVKELDAARGAFSKLREYVLDYFGVGQLPAHIREACDDKAEKEGGL